MKTSSSFIVHGVWNKEQVAFEFDDAEAAHISAATSLINLSCYVS